MITEETIKPIIEISLGQNGGSFSFNTFEELSEWINNERSKWVWLNTLVQQNGVVSWVAQKQNKIFWDLDRLLQEAINLRTQKSSQLNQKINQIRNWLIDNFNQEKCLYSDSDRGRFIFEYRKNQPVLAAFILGIFINAFENMPPQNNTASSMLMMSQAAVAAYFFEKGISQESISIAKNNFEEAREKWQLYTDEKKKELNEHTKQSKNLFEAMEQQFITHKTEFQNGVNSNQKEFSELVSNSKNELLSFEESIKNKIALQAPIKYWKLRKKSHTWGVRIYFSLSFIWGIGGVLFLWVLGKDFLGDATWAALHSTIPLWHFPLAIIAITIFLWIERIFVRLLLSNSHLQTDAGERVTMIETFLSLVEAGNITNEDRVLILNSIFRPNKTGIIEDDGMPKFALLQQYKNLQ